ncbi:MAG: alpha-galactosidase, partial [Lachnospiraceae bacterium]|nr:alpha-galactosidase [Lachnospiraceae bacterium]
MKLITLQTKNTTYQMGINRLGFLLHLYYGAKTENDMSYLLQGYDRGFAGNPYDAGKDRTLSLDVLPQEFPCYGTGDFRSAAFRVRNGEGISGVDLRYQGHCVKSGKYYIPGMPAVYEDEEKLSKEERNCEPGQEALCTGEGGSYTVEVTLADQAVGVEVVLKYGVLPELDVITRSAVVRNTGPKNIYINKVFSSTLDFLTGDYDLLHFHGRHTMERNLERIPLMHGKQGFGSRRGTSSHQHNPFAILAERETTEDHGGCYGMMLLYSGNFSFEVEQDQYRQVRIQMGMLDEMMDYPLEPEECLYVPEAAMAYSARGLSTLSHLFHKMIREHVCRGYYKKARRP